MRTAGIVHRILVVEDNPGDIRLLQELLRDTALSCTLEVAKSTGQALDFLQGCVAGAGQGLPDLIFLDVHLPGQNGIQLLEQIKTTPRLQRIPVVVLSSSAAAPDIAAAYDRHANCYIVKPIQLEEFIQKIRLVLDFWFTAAMLPGEEL